MSFCREGTASLARLDGSKKGPWRQVLKTLTVLEYLMTHGPNSLQKEFRGEISCIKELSQFNYTDQQGGSTVQKKAYRVLELLYNPDLRKEERTRARKISFGIRGFGSSLNQEPPGDAVEDQSRGRDSEGMSLSSKNSAEESVNAVNTTQLAHKQDGLMMGWRSDMFTEQWSKEDGMSTAPSESTYSVFEGMGTFSFADNCQPSMQWYGNFSNFPILPQPAHPKLRMKFQHQWQPTSLIDCDAKFGKAV